MSAGGTALLEAPPAEAPAPARARRSWVDALTAVVERLPVPPWLVYLPLALLLGGTSVALRWADGSYPFPQLAPITTVFACAGAYVLGVVHYLDRAARRALAEFRPALGTLEPRYAELERRLTTMPPWQALLAIGLGAIPPVAGHLGGGWGITQQTSLATNLYTVAVQLLLNVLVAVFFMRVARQLATIVRIHREADGIRLSDPVAHSAFSRYTFRAAVLIAIPYALVEVAAGLLNESTVVELVLLALALLLSVAVFVLPLRGMHARLVTLKQRQLDAIEQAFDRAGAELTAAVGAGAGPRELRAASEAVTALGVARERVRHLSAWPWSPQALRGFLSSIAVPVALWLATPVLEGMLPG